MTSHVHFRRQALGAILLLAAELRLWQLDRNGFGNEYYSAGVRSMTLSWHNFFYNSFDPAGFVSLDKPPLAFWLQVASAKLLGFSEAAVHLPQLLEGLASIGLLYWLVARRFGTPAGLAAALVLALTPIAVAVDRSTNTESALVLCLLLASWATIIACERGRLGPLLLAALAVAAAFNVKMLAALPILPALALPYLAFAPRPLAVRLMHGLAAMAVAIPLALSWTLAFDLTPPAARPYAGSSSGNSMLELVFAHNALDRFVLPGRRQDGTQAPAAPRPATARSAFFDDVPVGPLRLAEPHLARQVLWLLPLIAVGLLGWAVAARASASVATDDDRQGAAAGPPDGSGSTSWRIDLMLWLGWALGFGGLYSFAGGIFHAYYLATLAPALAALAGIGWAGLGAILRHDRGWRRWLPIGALIATTAWQLHYGAAPLGWAAAEIEALAQGRPLDLLRRAGEIASWPPVLLVAGVTAAVTVLAMVRPVRLARGAWIAAGLALLALPAAWSIGCAIHPGNSMLPAARLAEFRQPARLGDGIFIARRLANGRVALDARLLAYLTEKRGTARFMVAVPNARLAAPLIIASGQPVMAIGGFSGSDPILNPQQLAARIAQGEVRYLMIGSFGSFGLVRGSEARRQAWLAWARENGRTVDPRLWQSPGSPARGLQLFDMTAGRAGN